MLQACLNGQHEPGAHPELPTHPAALARAAAAAAAAGADNVHIHQKDPRGVDSLSAADLDRCLSAVQSAVDVPIGVTTGEWIEPDPRRRLDLIASWTAKPSFASVNWHEEGAEAVAGQLLDRGIGVEAGLFDTDAARLWIRSANAQACLRALIELPDELDESQVHAYADEMLTVVRSANLNVPILLHGSGPSCWPALRYASAMGVDTRIGMEDTLTLSNGAPALDNAQLVTHAREHLDRASCDPQQ